MPLKKVFHPTFALIFLKKLFLPAFWSPRSNRAQCTRWASKGHYSPFFVLHIASMHLSCFDGHKRIFPYARSNPLLYQLLVGMESMLAVVTSILLAYEIKSEPKRALSPLSKTSKVKPVFFCAEQAERNSLRVLEGKFPFRRLCPDIACAVGFVFFQGCFG